MVGDVMTVESGTYFNFKTLDICFSNYCLVLLCFSTWYMWNDMSLLVCRL